MSLQRQTARLAQEQQEAMKRVAQDTVRESTWKQAATVINCLGDINAFVSGLYLPE